MKNIIAILTLATLGACSSTPAPLFSGDKASEERIVYKGKVVARGDIHIVKEQTLEQAIRLEQVRRERAEKMERLWMEEFSRVEKELLVARTALGLPAERPACNPFPCKEGQIRPTSTILEELSARDRGVYGRLGSN
jgi:hypothetical protein